MRNRPSHLRWANLPMPKDKAGKKHLLEALQHAYPSRQPQCARAIEMLVAGEPPDKVATAVNMSPQSVARLTRQIVYLVAGIGHVK